MIEKGSPLHYLCHPKWKGSCTSTKGHTPLCLRCFHNKQFKLPIDTHVRALEIFFELASDMNVADAREALLDYTGALKRTYSADDIVYICKSNPRLRLFLRKNFGQPLKDSQQLRAETLMELVELGGVARSLIPLSPEELLDWSGQFSQRAIPLTKAERYIAWLSAVKQCVREDDVPALTRAIKDVLDQRLPVDVHVYVTQHLFKQKE